MKHHPILLLVALPIWAHAQTPPPSEFPGDVTTPTADALSAHLADKRYDAQPANGPAWRLELKAGGFAFLDLANGNGDKGTWRTEDGRLCIEWRRIRNSGCSEARLKGDTVYLKRSSGEVVALVPR